MIILFDPTAQQDLEAVIQQAKDALKPEITCAWCRQEQRLPELPVSLQVSHGICEKCREKMREMI